METGFYPYPLWGGRPLAGIFFFEPTLISIHALREEGDPRSIMRLQVRYNFYPRPPRGGRPARKARKERECKISIHALHEEGDPPGLTGRKDIPYFYPRPPRGGRRSLDGLTVTGV